MPINITTNHYIIVLYQIGTRKHYNNNHNLFFEKKHMFTKKIIIIITQILKSYHDAYAKKIAHWKINQNEFTKKTKKKKNTTIY